jgi:hypothetical protein
MRSYSAIEWGSREARRRAVIRTETRRLGSTGGEFRAATRT